MKWTREFGHYYSEDRRYMIEKDAYFGWSLWAKSAPTANVFDDHIINCDTLRECKEVAERYAAEAAAREAVEAAETLAAIRTPGNIEIRAKEDCRIGDRFVKKGTHYIITVYGDGTQELPGNAYGKLYDFRTAQHAIYFEIVSRPETAQEAPEEAPTIDEYKAAATEALRAFEAAGVISNLIIEPQPADVVNVRDYMESLDTGDHGDGLTDYRDSSSYICDAIFEIADNRTSIYYSDIMDFLRENPESLAEVIDEGLYDPSHEYDVYKHAQAAEYMTIERDIYNHLADSLLVAALNFILYDLKLETIPGDLADQLREWCDDADNNDRMDTIPDRIREYFGEEDEDL